MSGAGEIALGALDALWRQLVLGLGLVFALGALLYAVQWATHRALHKAIGFRGIVIWTGWLGTPVHEFSHYVVGKLFGLDITEVKPFAPDPQTGVLGYVAYRRPELSLTSLHKVIGTFAMGIAPLFGGTAVLWAASRLLIDPASDGSFRREARELTELVTTGGPMDVLRGFYELTASLYGAVFQHGAGDWRTWVFLYVALAVGAHLAPSSADLKGGLRGFLVLCGVALLANTIALLAGAQPTDAVAPLASASSWAAALLILALMLNLGNLAVSWLLAAIVTRVRD